MSNFSILETPVLWYKFVNVCHSRTVHVQERLQLILRYVSTLVATVAGAVVVMVAMKSGCNKVIATKCPLL